MKFNLSSLCYGFGYRNDEFPHVRVLCNYDPGTGDLDSFVCCEDHQYSEHWYHENVNIHEDDLQNYLDNLIRNVWYQARVDWIKEL